MIPKNYVERYLEKAEGSKFFGISILDMSRDELIACAIAGWERANSFNFIYEPHYHLKYGNCETFSEFLEKNEFEM